MFKYEIEPRMSDIDGLGHIHNTVLPVWFEEARKSVYQIFNPGLHLDQWNFVITRYEVEISRQIFHTRNVQINTFIERIGTKSLVVHQLASQAGEEVASCRTVIVYFDYANNRTAAIPGPIRRELQAHTDPEASI